MFSRKRSQQLTQEVFAHDGALLNYPLILSSFFLDEQNSWFVDTIMVLKHGIAHSPVKLTQHLHFIKQKHLYPFHFNHFPGIDIIFWH